MGRFRAAVVLPVCLAVSGFALTIPAVAQTAAASTAAKPVEVTEANDLYEFRYAYPAQAAAIPALKKWLQADLASKRRAIMESARDTKAYLEEGDFFSPHTHDTQWQVVANLPGWLSLSGSISEYTGGAHPNYWPDSILWDKQAQVRRKATDLFISPAALSAAIRRPFCQALNRERAERRGEPVIPQSGDGFTECVDPVESTVLLGSADKLHFTRIGIELAPYVAGPYSEGGYSITLPVTPAVLRAVKPQYRAAFAVGR